MDSTVDVTFHEIWPTDEVMGRATRHAADLQRGVGPLESCRVVVERPKGGRGKRRRYRVTVALELAEPWIEASAISEHARLRSAVDGAFRTASSRLRRDLAARAAA